MDRRLLLSVMTEVLIYVLHDLPVAPKTFCDQLAVEPAERLTKQWSRPMDEELRRVVCNGHYTYSTDLPVQLGTRVMLPPPDGREKPWPGTVTELSSDYIGPCKRILEIIGYPVMLSVEEAGMVLTGLAMLQTSLLSDPARVAQIEALCARVVGDPT